MSANRVNESQSFWQQRLQNDLPQIAPDWRLAVLNWLLGNETILPAEGTARGQELERRYCILQQRYLGVGPVQGYQRLLNRLGCLIVRYPKLRRRLAHNDQERQTVIKLIQTVIEELLSEDAYLQGQKQRIAQCTEEPELRDALLFAILEEYCLQKSSSQPRLIARMISLLRRQLAM